jgi:hypothetical protein
VASTHNIKLNVMKNMCRPHPAFFKVKLNFNISPQK